jgi:hypothetical protein
MPDIFLALRTDLIPQPTKDYVPNYADGYFSNDGSRYLFPYYNAGGDLLHPQSTFDNWLQWSENPQEIQNALESTAIQCTTATRSKSAEVTVKVIEDY